MCASVCARVSVLFRVCVICTRRQTYRVKGKTSFELLAQGIVFVNDVDLLEHGADLLVEALFDAADADCQLFSA